MIAAVTPGPALFVAAWIALYLTAAIRARRRAGPRGAPAWKIACGLTGLAALAAALLSPIDRLAEESFTMHMVQHLMLADIAPVLILVGSTKVMLRPIARRMNRTRSAVGPLANPWFAVALYVAVMWGWHVPAFYDVATKDPTLHVAGHSLFLWAGVLYWWHLLSPVRRRQDLAGLAPIMYMVVTKVLVGALGAALTFAPNSLYDAYDNEPRIGGLDPRDDESLGGVIMSVEQSVVMGIALAWLFVRALSDSEKADRRRDLLEDRRLRS